MTREEAIELLYDIQTDAVYNILLSEKEAIDMAIKALEQEPRWIPVNTRSMTDEERKKYGVEAEFMYDCVLPEDGQDVLITTPWGVRYATFYTDYEDEGDVIAWMPLPEPYEEVEE